MWFITIILGGFISALFIYFAFCRKPSSEKVVNGSTDVTSSSTSSMKKDPKPQNKPQNIIKNISKPKSSQGTDKQDNKYFWKEIGGHTSPVCGIAFSVKENLVGSSNSEGIVRCMPISSIGAASPLEVYTKLDKVPTAMCFTQNAKRLILGIESMLHFYAVQINQEHRKFEFVKSISSNLNNISSIHILDVEQWMVIVLCGESVDGPTVVALDPKGRILNRFTQIKRVKSKADKQKPVFQNNPFVVTSPDDHFVAIYGVTDGGGKVTDGDVGIYDIARNSDGSAIGLNFLFSLSGHTSDVIAFSFSPLSTTAISLCANGAWRLWDTTIRYNESEQPRLFSNDNKINIANNIVKPLFVSLLSNGIVIFADAKNLYMCNTASGDVVDTINNACTDNIICMKSDGKGEYVATVVNNTKRIPVWKFT
jgi:WD40 repeat protein